MIALESQVSGILHTFGIGRQLSSGVNMDSDEILINTD